MTAKYTQDQYGGALMALMPRGRLWNNSISLESAAVIGQTIIGQTTIGETYKSVQNKLLVALCSLIEQVDSDAITLIENAFPSQATDMLPEWNKALQIPDPLLGAPISLLQNQQEITAKLIATGGQSIPYIIAIAASLGLTITITEFSAAFPATDAPLGMILKPDDNAYTIRINTSGGAGYSYFSVSSAVNDPLSTSPYNGNVLDLMIRKYKPAHLQYYFR